MKFKGAHFALSTLSGLGLYLSWPQMGFSPLVLVALVPLLWVVYSLYQSKATKTKRLVFFYAWWSFALWNGLTGWWISLAHWSGLVAVVFIAASLHALAMVAWLQSLTHLGEKKGLLALPFLWLIPEWILRDWDMDWPWLELGNAFAHHPKWIQWYEYTGVFGGSVWVVVANLLILTGILRMGRGISPIRAFYTFGIWVFVPLSYSLYRYYSFDLNGEKVQVLVVQPNIEPYTEKFEMPVGEQLTLFLREAEPYVNEETDYLIGPETLIPNGLNLDQLKQEPTLKYLESFRQNFPNLHMVLGANTIKRYSHQATNTARQLGSDGYWYDVHNTALQMSAADSIPVYHKSKLVVGAEKMPFMQILEPILGELVLDFGGMAGTNRTQNHREVFVHDNGKAKVAPIICWENEFGGFVTEYVRKGASLLLVITNDGWWGNSEGHKQHLHYARLRAIENRRSLARSANTGISAIINARGDLVQTLGWEKRGVLTAEVTLNENLSFYSRYGDYVLRIGVFIGLGFLLYTLSRALKNKRAKS